MGGSMHDLGWPPGLLVHGGNHFIVRGPQPDQKTALALVRQWSVIQIGHTGSPELQAWRISTREFRENLAWAIVVENGEEQSDAVVTLLAELADRGIRILIPRVHPVSSEL